MGTHTTAVMFASYVDPVGPGGSVYLCVADGWGVQVRIKMMVAVAKTAVSPVGKGHAGVRTSLP